MTTRERLDHTMTLVSGMIIGATVMYIFDANRGSRRRAYARDRVIHAGHLLGRGVRKHGRDWVNRALGSLAEMRSGIRDRMTTISDEQLVDRVRSQLGHVVSHSGLLRVDASDGCVIVTGPVLEGEGEKIRRRLAETRGVRDFVLDVEPQGNLDQVSGQRGSRKHAI